MTQSPHYLPWYAVAFGRGVGQLLGVLSAARARFAMKKWAKVVLGASLLAATILAIAQNGPESVSEVNICDIDPSHCEINNTVSEPVKVTKYNFSQEDVIRQIAEPIQSTLDNIRSSEKLVSIGELIAFFLFFAMLVWTSVKTLAGGQGISGLIGEWVPIFVAMGIVMLFMNPAVTQSVIDTMNTIGKTMIPLPPGSAAESLGVGNLGTSLHAVLGPVFRAITVVFDTESLTSTIEWYRLDALPAKAIGWLLAMIGKLFTVILLILAMVGMAATVIMVNVSVTLAFVLAPILVPFLLFRPLEFLFSSWLRFLLGACMLQIVGSFFVYVGTQMLSGLSVFAAKMVADASDKGRSFGGGQELYFDIVLHGVMIILVVLTMLLIQQASTVAQSLVGSSGGGGFQGIKSITQSPGARVTSAAMGGAARGAVGGAKAIGALGRGLEHGRDMRGADGVARSKLSGAAYNAGLKFAGNRTQGPVLPRDRILAGNNKK